MERKAETEVSDGAAARDCVAQTANARSLRSFAPSGDDNERECATASPCGTHATEERPLYCCFVLGRLSLELGTGFFAGVVAFAVGVVGAAASVKVMLVMEGGSAGRPPSDLGRRAIFWTRSTVGASHCPKRV